MDYVIYHRADFDGLCSAAILYHKGGLKDATFIGLDYNDEFDELTIPDGSTVYIVDFALQPYVRMAHLSKRVNLIHIDHHISAIEALADCNDIKKYYNTIETPYISAAALVWAYISEVQNDVGILPLVVEYVSLFDTWHHRNDPDILALQLGLKINTTGYKDPRWRVMFNTDKVTKQFIEQGLIIQKYIDATNTVMAGNAFDINFEGLNFKALNAGKGGSLMFKIYNDSDCIDAYMSFGYNGTIWTVSMYQHPKNGDCDILAIAKKYGGGGHKGACGFQIKDIQEVLNVSDNKTMGI